MMYLFITNMSHQIMKIASKFLCWVGPKNLGKLTDHINAAQQMFADKLQSYKHRNMYKDWCPLIRTKHISETLLHLVQIKVQQSFGSLPLFLHSKYLKSYVIIRITNKGVLASTNFYSLIYFHNKYTNSLVNADWFYANFTNTTFHKIPIPHLIRTMKQKSLH